MAARAASFLAFIAATAFAQTGVERVSLSPSYPWRVIAVGTTSWIAAGNRELLRVEGSIVSTISLPQSGSGPYDLATAPGALWLLTSTAIVRYEIATGNATVAHAAAFTFLDRIVAAADGTLWFTRGNTLLRMTQGGAVTELALPFLATDLAATPAAIWVVGGPQQFLGASETVLRFALDGSRTTFAVPHKVGIVEAGPSGDVWLSREWFATALVHLDGAGTVLHSFRVPRHLTIAVAPSGDVWLADLGADIHLIRNATRTTYRVPNPPACHENERNAMTVGADGLVRIIDRPPPAASVPCLTSPLPDHNRPSLLILNPSQLVAVSSTPLEMFAAIPVASMPALIVFALALTAAALLRLR